MKVAVLGSTGYVVTDCDRPARTLVVYQDTHPATCAALRELDARLASVTPAREAGSPWLVEVALHDLVIALEEKV